MTFMYSHGLIPQAPYSACVKVNMQRREEEMKPMCNISFFTKRHVDGTHS